MSNLIQLITALTGSFGFAMLFNVRRSKLIPAALGGGLAWGIYLLVNLFTDVDVLCYFIAAVILTFYAEIFARIKKAPTTIFLVSGAIPLFPGGFLYQTMRYAVMGEWKKFFHEGLNTLLIALAIAVGMLVTMTVFSVRKRILEMLEKKKTQQT